MRNNLAALAVCVPLASCTGWQSVLEPHSTQAGHLANLFWFFLIVCSIIWLLVAGALILAARRRVDSEAPGADSAPQARRKTMIVSVLVGLSVMILTVFTLVSFYATREVTWHDSRALTVKVTGRQWWWDIDYPNDDPQQAFRTANEIHIPVGQVVTLELDAADVIHSFWVPNLMGKQDLIPGRKNYLTLRADKAGLYRGQCAEFCGLEHAYMGILVFAQSPAAFEAWRQQQLVLAKTPGAPQRVAGLQIFLNHPCASCHAIAGTDAGGRFGPDLTHFGGRATIAAARLTNTPKNLDAWIRDPQVFKPGVNMPKVDLSDSDRAQLVAYLEGLT